MKKATPEQKRVVYRDEQSSSGCDKAQSRRKPSSFCPSKNTWRKALDLGLYLVACVTAGTGLLLAYRLPHGAEHGSRVIFLGYGRHEWGDIHTWFAFLAILLVVIHLAFNWQWLVKVAASNHIWRIAAGIFLGLLIVGAFLLLPVERAERHRQEGSDSSVKGTTAYGSQQHRSR